MSVTIRKGNLSPSLFDTIRQGGTPFDLTGSTAKLQARFHTATTLKIDAAASIIATASTLSASTTLPDPSIPVASTTGFLASGAFTVGGQIVEYDEISGNTFLGCRGGDGTIAAATPVTQRGGVRYDWISADVDTVGDLDAWWRVTLPTTKVQETPIFDLVVEDPTAVFRGLCELADVFSYARGYRSDAETDGLLERLILAKTRQIQRETHKEFVAVSPAVATRRYDLSQFNLDERKVYIDPLVSAPSSVRLISGDQTTVVSTITSADWVALPYTRDSWQPITGLRFPSGTPAAAGLTAGYLLEVTGVWGYPSVPDDIREACASLVVSDYVANPALAGTSFSEALADVSVGQLFASARRVIDMYREPLVAWN